MERTNKNPHDQLHQLWHCAANGETREARLEARFSLLHRILREIGVQDDVTREAA